MASHCPGFLGKGNTNPLNQFRIPGSSHSRTGREAGGRYRVAGVVIGHRPCPVRTVGHLNGRNPEALDTFRVPEVGASQHRHLLFERHPAQQVFEPSLHGTLLCQFPGRI